MKLIDPWYKADDKGRVQGNLSPEVFDYFFRGVFAGERTNIRGILTKLLFQKLHAECVRIGIHPSFDPNNESRIAELIDRLNFTDVAGLEQQVRDLNERLDAGTKPTTTRPKRANPRSPVNKG